MKIRILTTLALLSGILASCGEEKGSDLNRDWGNKPSWGGGHDSHSSGGEKWGISCYGKAFSTSNPGDALKFSANSSKTYKSEGEASSDRNEVASTFIALRNDCSSLLNRTQKLNNAVCSNMDTSIPVGKQGSTIVNGVALDWKCEVRKK